MVRCRGLGELWRVLHGSGLLLATAACAAPAVVAQLTNSQPGAEPVVHIRVTMPARPQVIPKTVFGSFLEPIGHSTYGGLWADPIENPSFEDGLWSANNVSAILRERPELRRPSDLGLPLPWQPLDSSQGNRYLPVRRDAANSTQSLLVMGLSGKEVGVLQRIYLPVQRELSYGGSVMLKHVRGPAEVNVTLRRHAHPEQVLARAAVEASAESWAKYPFTLTLQPGQVQRLEPVDLVISLRDDARVRVDNVVLNPADAVEGMDPEVLTMARQLETPLVRFGGNFTSGYDWHDGVGPRDKRVSMLNASWGIPEYNTFGTDEFLRFCELIGAKPQIALNLGTGTPGEAADWVRYVDERWGTHEGGQLWELGNELWGNWQIGYPLRGSIASTTLATSKAVHGVDPHARLIATGADEDGFRDWNAQQLASPPGTFDYLSTHFVVEDSVRLPDASDEFRTMAALALPWGLGERMHAIQQQATEAGQPQVHVAFTEWLMVSPMHTGPSFTNLGGALFAGGFLNMVMRHADIVPISDMTGILEFGGIWKKRGQVYGAPAYWVLREYSRAHPHWLLETLSDGPTYSVAQGVTRLPEIKDVPYLDCVSAEAEDRRGAVITCVNRDLTRAAEAEFDFSGLRVASGEVKVSSIAGDNLLAENDEQRPNRIVPQPETVAVRPGKPFRYSFPNASVTVIQVPLAGER